MDFTLIYLVGKRSKTTPKLNCIDLLKWIVNYFDIPITLRLTSTSGTYFEIGPQFGFLTAAEESFEGSSTNGIEDYSDVDIKSAFESTNIAVILGFGVDIDVKTGIIVELH